MLDDVSSRPRRQFDFKILSNEIRQLISYPVDIGQHLIIFECSIGIAVLEAIDIFQMLTFIQCAQRLTQFNILAVGAVTVHCG